MLAVAFDWDHLLFEHYPVEPDVVAPHLPDGLDVDTYDGRAWLSVVPFVNAAVRPAGLPRRLGLDLPVRTDVTHGDDAGVYLSSLHARGVLGVAGARVGRHRSGGRFRRRPRSSPGRAVRRRRVRPPSRRARPAVPHHIAVTATRSPRARVRAPSRRPRRPRAPRRRCGT